MLIVKEFYYTFWFQQLYKYFDFVFFHKFTNESKFSIFKLFFMNDTLRLI